MEWQKIILYAALAMIGFSLWTNWQKQHIPAVQTHRATTTQGRVSQAQQTTGVAQTPSAMSDVVTAAADVPKSRILTVQTDTLTAKIDTLGGNIIYTSLPKYTTELNNSDTPYVLFNRHAKTLYLAQSGLIKDGKKLALPFAVNQKNVQLRDGQNDLTVNLVWKNQQGVVVTKSFHFERGSYVIRSDYHIANNSGAAFNTQVFHQLLRKKIAPKKKGFFHISAYLGASLSDPKNKLYEKVSFKAMASDNIDRQIKGGWVAMQEHYFLSAWIPPGDQKSQFFTKDHGNDVFSIGYLSPHISIAPGQSKTLSSRLYVGPENMKALKKIAPGLDLTIDYGLLWFISALLFRLMHYIYQVVGNWGWAIVLVTLLIKAVFYKLSASSYRSMANMRKLQPKIEMLRKRHSEDKQKLSQAMMELYKKEKINPLGGCLPIVIQIPVFIALYWVLIESVELRHAPFILWIRDLSAPDPFYILPIIMGVTMLVQQKLNPPPPDPTQAKVMMMLPVVFTFLFLYFPAGLVLYWVVNNLLSVLQQWYITRQYEAKKA